MQHGERRERIRGEAAAAAASVLWAGPCVRSAAVRHGLGCGGRRRRGAPDSAYSEAPGRHVSRAASLQSPRGLARSGSRLARSLHLLPLAVLQPVRNDAVSGGGEADGVSAGGGKEPTETSRGASRRARGAAAAGCTGGRAGGRPRRRRRDARRGNLRPGRLVAGGSSPGLCPTDVAAPRSGGDAPALPLRREPELKNCLESAPFPKKSKQTVFTKVACPGTAFCAQLATGLGSAPKNACTQEAGVIMTTSFHLYCVDITLQWRSSSCVLLERPSSITMMNDHELLQEEMKAVIVGS
ncbi:uncharacterized protein LOC121105368 [Ursus maritimus]|uniref:Uncharacterized protein LOC121105368 n=1 Tax=Ursus maritimus TaxID=29073 RepID=A0A8M1GSV7_URSMA|nr:uncharacterized protein LOC121105368 [Ursus maritimus]